MARSAYRRFLAAAGASNLGDGIVALAVPWVAAMITRDALLVGLVAAATRLPWFLLTIPAGVVTDRMDRKSLLRRADLSRSVLAAGLALTVLVAGLPLPDGDPRAIPLVLALAAFAFLLGAAEVLRDNAAQTVLPAIVGRGRLERANGRLWSVELTAGQFIGPPVAGVLVAVSVGLPYGAVSLAYLLAAVLVGGITIAPRTAAPRAPFLQEAATGLRWMASHALIRRLAIILGILNAASTAALTFLVFFAREILGLPAEAYGLLLTATAIGGITGSLAGPRIAARLGGTATVLIALGLMTAAHFVVWRASSPLLVGFALFIEFGAGMIWNVVTVSYRQRAIPDALLGRVNSIYRFFGWGMMPLGALAGGALIAVLETSLGRIDAIRAVYLAAGALTGLCLLYAVFRVRIPAAAEG